jgi:hypothetical protein
MGSFHPDLLALEGTLKLLQHTQLVIVAVDPGFAVDVFEDVLGPATGNNPLDGNCCFEVAAPRGQRFLDGVERFDTAFSLMVQTR